MSNNDNPLNFVMRYTLLRHTEEPNAELQTLITTHKYTLVADFADFIAISKAPQISVHRDQDTVGLVERIAADLQCDKLFLVHRLDRMTSGLLLLAKTAQACAALAAAFEQRTVEKYYFALANAKPHKKQGWVIGDMLRARNGSWRLAPTHEDPAVTQFFSRSLRPGLRLFILRPRTGRTHQLRVAMKSLGAPILGDDRYGGEPADRGYLHAYALRFTYAGQFYEVCTPAQQGEYFEDVQVRAALETVAQPWLLPWPDAKKQTTKQKRPS